MIKKIIFLHKNGHLLNEFPLNYTIDRFFFYPISISYMLRILIELDYCFVIVNKKVFLGTENLPRVLFFESQIFILKLIKNEGRYLYTIYIIYNEGFYLFKKKYILHYNIKKYDHYIILSPITILSQQSFIDFMNYSTIALLSCSWNRIYKILKFCYNECSYKRRSKETNIQIFFKIEGKGISYIYTGLGFFDHLIDQICIHANIDIGLMIRGDVHVDEHHTIEDSAISIGNTVSKILKNKRGIVRYGFLLPMDDTLVQVIIDLGGRNNFIWKVIFKREKIGDLPTEMFTHFFKSFSDVIYCNLYVKAEGENEHHKIEGIFKAFACALKMATSRNYINNKLLSSKEIL